MERILKNNTLSLLLIGIISGLTFIPLIGNCPLFDWDEINFAECAREMIVSGNYSKVQLNYQPFWEKPPVFIWMQALCMQLFGINEFAARLPNAVCGIVTLMTLFYLGKKYFTIKVGFFWCLLYGSTILPHLYFRAGLIDPWFNYFIFLSLLHIAITLNDFNSKSKYKNASLAGLFLGIAVLTKGPAAIVIVGLIMLLFIILKKQWLFLKSKTFLLFILSTLVISGSWFLGLYLNGNKDIILEFLIYQKRLAETADAGHDGPFYYHVIILLVGCFPASIFFINNYRNTESLTPFQKHVRLILLLLFWVVLILFSIIKTKIVHYSSLCYFPITFIAALAISNLNITFKKYQSILYWFLSILLIGAFIVLGTINFYKESLLQLISIPDKFTLGNIKADVYWNGFEWFIAVLLFLALLFIYKGVLKKHYQLLTLGFSALTVFLVTAVNVFIPKIEQYSQHAAIEFYKQIKNIDCYTETQRFKSYAYLFYTDRKPSHYVNSDQKIHIENFLDQFEKEGNSRITSYATANLQWMKRGKIDKPAFIVCKVDNEKDLEEIADFKKLYSKNGFSFYLRKPN